MDEYNTGNAVADVAPTGGGGLDLDGVVEVGGAIVGFLGGLFERKPAPTPADTANAEAAAPTAPRSPRRPAPGAIGRLAGRGAPAPAPAPAAPAPTPPIGETDGTIAIVVGGVIVVGLVIGGGVLLLWALS